MALLKDIVNLIEGTAKYHLASALPVHEREQAALRAYLCQECLLNGKCTECGCKTPEMFYAPSKTDKKLRYAEFFNASQWEALKHNIDDYYGFIKSLKEEHSSGEGQ